MSKIKMRCTTCGKWFQSANAKEVTCPDCVQKARKEKLAAKTTPSATSKSSSFGGEAATRSVPPPPKPKPAASGTSHWLDAQNDVKIGEPEQPPPRPKLPSTPASRDNRSGPERGSGYRSTEPGLGAPSTHRDDRGPGSSQEGNTRGPGNYRENDYRGPGNYRENNYRTPYRVGGGMGLPETTIQRPRQPMPDGPQRGPRSDAPSEPRPDKFRQGRKPFGQKTKTPKPKSEAPPKPKREKIPPPAPFKPTEEQIAQVEARYMELAVPTEFDGIRTQISKELNIPKTAVKKIIKDFREKEHIPSWWEAQTYKGSSEELEKIKAVYEPMLPLPPIGIHKQIAEQLSLKPGDVYQAIKTIRQELNLPQYNDPSLHGLEKIPPKQKPSEAGEATSGTEPAEAKPESEAGEARTVVELAEVKPEGAEPQAADEKPGTMTVPTADQQPDVVTTPTAEEKSEPIATSPSAQQPEAVETPTIETNAGEITSIETDTEFHKLGDTIEVVVAGSTDTKTEGEA